MRRITDASPARAFTLSICFFVAVTSVVLCGCAKPGQEPAETKSSTPAQPAQPPPAATQQPEPQKAAEMGPPKLSEVQSAIARVYENTVTVDPDRFLVGDLDGDNSQDLIAVVRPVRGMLSEINSELARWRLQDPRKVNVPKVTKGMQMNPAMPAPVRAEQSDSLMVVIHGHGPNGWRNPEAMNTYLLKNAVGSGISLQSWKEAQRAARGKGRPVNLRGDVIKQSLGGEPGFLFWTGADYAWHPLQKSKTSDRRATPGLDARS